MTTEQATEKNRVREIVCPFCNSADNELFSLFGQTLIGTQYYCRNCHTVFEVVRWEERDDEEKENDGL
jgi:hypothetical protein